jgi:hypothetical protein
MNSLNKLPMALTVLGLGAAASFAEIKVGDNLSLSGFLDMSANGMVDSADDADATLGANVDQFELDFMYKFGDKVSARVDVNSLSGGDVTFEQGFVTANLGSVALSTGRFLSSSGFEAAEPTGLYQYSTSKTLVYGGYQNGVNVAWTSPMIGLYGAIVTDLWVATETELLNTPGFEGQVALTPGSGITAKATMLWQLYDEAGPNADEEQGLLNVWGQYAAGPITAAAEYNMLISWDLGGAANDESGHGWLAMANYKFTDMFAATLRYSGIILGDGDPDQEVTVSPSVAIAANWLALAEYRFNIDSQIQQYALETTLSF